MRLSRFAQLSNMQATPKIFSEIITASESSLGVKYRPCAKEQNKVNLLYAKVINLTANATDRKI